MAAGGEVRRRPLSAPGGPGRRRPQQAWWLGQGSPPTLPVPPHLPHLPSIFLRFSAIKFCTFQAFLFFYPKLLGGVGPALMAVSAATRGVSAWCACVVYGRR
eukprot:COSAG04_NODE_1288_length_7365_cov_12.007707_6_plen_102_part_00